MKPAITGVPMYFPPSIFDLDLAVTCAKIVDTAYAMETQWKDQGKPKEKKFEWQPPDDGFDYSAPIWGESEIFAFLERKEPFGFTARCGAQVFLAFRGTATQADDVEDLEIRQVDYDVPGLAGFGKVQKGFSEIYSSMRETVLAALGTPPSRPGQVVVTGHSMGSALSTLAFPDLLTNSGYRVPEWDVVQYNLASPRLGDVGFAASYDGLAAAQGWKNALTYRIVNVEDLVPETPPAELRDASYQHVGIAVDFSAQYGGVLANHSNHDTYLYALEHPDAPIDPSRLAPG
jgi:hypothetical protein